MVVDPFRTGDGNRLLVTTSSGATHIIDASDPDGAVTVTRVTVNAARKPSAEFPLADLRRDGAPVRLAAVQHAVDGRLRDGIVIGRAMYLTLEPLGNNADFDADPAGSLTLP